MPSRLPLLPDSRAYNEHIRIAPPKMSGFDLRDFEENMASVQLRMPPFRIGFYQLAVLESGSGLVSTDGKKLQLGEHSLFFNLPGQIIYWDVAKNWKGYYLNLEEQFYTQALDGYPRLADLPFFRTYQSPIQLEEEEATNLLELMQRMQMAYRTENRYRRHILKALLQAILAYTLSAHARQADHQLEEVAQQGPAARFVNIVQERIRARSLGIDTAPLSPAELAQELFISPQHLSKVVKAATGYSPIRYLQHNLIAEAQKLLRATPLSIAEIGFQLGYEDPAYFSRLFKKVTGVSPSIYRNRAR
ncbi:MAG: AraC family transcriptional regulator [Bacteroidota bacterium]